jgi:nitrite reductase (NADH) small subunit
MSEGRWVRVTACDNVPPREGRAAMVGDCEIALFNLGDRFLAVDNRCPHQGGPLGDGIVTGAAVVCPLHGWKVNLETGAVERPTAAAGTCVRAYATRIEDSIVLVELVPNTDPALSVPDEGTHGHEVTKTQRNSSDERSRGHAA